VRILGNGSERSARTGKVVGSAAIVGAAAAVAALGTYGTVTDSTTPVATGGTSGVLSVSLMDGGSVATAPFQGGSFMPSTADGPAFHAVSSSLGFLLDGVQRAGADR
jgi:hypothetical protein